MASSRQFRSLRRGGHSQTLYSLPRTSDEHDHPNRAEEEDWVNLTDPIAKKRIQNRLAQRAYRKRVKARLHKLDVLQKQVNQPNPQSKSASELDSFTKHNAMESCLERSISPLSLPTESQLPRYNLASPPSTVDEIALQRIPDLTPTSTKSSISPHLHACDKAEQSHSTLTAFESCYPTHLGGYSVSMDTDQAAALWPPLKPDQPLINVSADSQANQTAHYFIDPWKSDVAYEPHHNMVCLQNMNHNFGVKVVDPQLEATDESTEQLGQDSALKTDKAMDVKGAEKRASSPTLHSSHQGVSKQQTVANLQRLGGLHIIIDTLRATTFTNFDDLVLFYYTGELSRSPRLAQEQRMSQSQRLSSVLHGLASVQAVLGRSR